MYMAMIQGLQHCQSRHRTSACQNLSRQEQQGRMLDLLVKRGFVYPVFVCSSYSALLTRANLVHTVLVSAVVKSSSF